MHAEFLNGLRFMILKFIIIISNRSEDRCGSFFFLDTTKCLSTSNSSPLSYILLLLQAHSHQVVGEMKFVVYLSLFALQVKEMVLLKIRIRQNGLWAWAGMRLLKLNIDKKQYFFSTKYKNILFFSFLIKNVS